jgi:hypothetical protein
LSIKRHKSTHDFYKENSLREVRRSLIIRAMVVPIPTLCRALGLDAALGRTVVAPVAADKALAAAIPGSLTSMERIRLYRLAWTVVTGPVVQPEAVARAAVAFIRRDQQWRYSSAVLATTPLDVVAANAVAECANLWIPYGAMDSPDGTEVRTWSGDDVAIHTASQYKHVVALLQHYVALLEEVSIVVPTSTMLAVDRRRLPRKSHDSEWMASARSGFSVAVAAMISALSQVRKTASMMTGLDVAAVAQPVLVNSGRSLLRFRHAPLIFAGRLPADSTSRHRHPRPRVRRLARPPLRLPTPVRRRRFNRLSGDGEDAQCFVAEGSLAGARA